MTMQVRPRQVPFTEGSRSGTGAHWGEERRIRVLVILNSIEKYASKFLLGAGNLGLELGRTGGESQAWRSV